MGVVSLSPRGVRRRGLEGYGPARSVLVRFLVLFRYPVCGADGGWRQRDDPGEGCARVVLMGSSVGSRPARPVFLPGVRVVILAPRFVLGSPVVRQLPVEAFARISASLSSKNAFSGEPASVMSTSR